MRSLEVVLDALSGFDTTVVSLPPRSPRYAPIPDGLSVRTVELLRAFGDGGLYTHQTEAINAIVAGENVAVVTGTGSGKSLTFMAATVEMLASEPFPRALFVYPTKALAQDQAQKLAALVPHGLSVGVYDGDTPIRQRSAIRKGAHVVLTNPDMLHSGILPRPDLWSGFWRSLRLVAIDEAHTYRGIFGSHVAWVLRRLQRVAAWHSASPRFVLASATLSNAAEHVAELLGVPCRIVDDDGGPQGEGSLVLVPGHPDGPSPTTTTAMLLASAAAQQVRTLAFCRARGTTEGVLRQARGMLERSGCEPGIIDAYRGGYTAAERRILEQQYFGGQLVGLAATSALELGIDVGELELVVMNGYPGTISRFWQQAGRAGRAGKPRTVVYVGRPEPLESSLIQNPETLLSTPFEACTVRSRNRYVTSDQLKCAAYERPIGRSELASFGSVAVEQAEALVVGAEAAWADDRLVLASYESPASKVSLRSTSNERVMLRVGSEAIGEMERWRACREAFPGAVYLHRGASFRVESLNLESAEAWLIPDSPEVFTRPIVQSVVETTVPIRYDAPWSLDGVRVTTMVLGYREIAFDGESLLAEHALELPPETHETIALRLDLPYDEMAAARIHAVEHALASVAPLVAGCDPDDLDTGWYVAFPDTGLGAVFLIDSAPGGIGLAEALFERPAVLLARASALLTTCPCETGCPHCLLSPRCELANDVLDKPGAVRELARLRGAF